MTTRSRGRQAPTPEERAQEEAASTTKNRRTLEKLSRLRARNGVAEGRLAAAAAKPKPEA
jgi:hypothetical protein